MRCRRISHKDIVRHFLPLPMGEVAERSEDGEGASKAPLGKELSALCRLRFGVEQLREMYDPSILPDTETRGH